MHIEGRNDWTLEGCSVKGKCHNISPVSESFQDSGPAKSLAFQAQPEKEISPSSSGPTMKKQHPCLMEFLGTEGEILHNDFSGYFES